jgi:hypothetical protein
VGGASAVGDEGALERLLLENSTHVSLLREPLSATVPVDAPPIAHREIPCSFPENPRPERSLTDRSRDLDTPSPRDGALPATLRSRRAKAQKAQA